MGSKCGTAIYSAPEILLEQSYIGPEVDIWALGVILYAMVTGCIPWVGNSLEEQLEHALIGDFCIPDYISPECLNLLTRILNPDPQKRATLTEVFLHGWVNIGSPVPLSSCVTARPPLKRELVDSEILSDMVKMGFQADKVINALEESRLTENCVGIYYLLVRNKARFSQPQEVKPPESQPQEFTQSESANRKLFSKFQKSTSKKMVEDSTEISELSPRKVRIQLENIQFIQQPLAEIMNKLESKLSGLGIQYKKDTKKGITFSCKEESQNLKFQLEICQPEIAPSVKVILHKRKRGELQSYKILIGRLCLYE
mmetsp:Transcript_22696/g.31609  ORF Transcript_22696/g.31609 Transcript_22696/m.31609 type:complete len:313 (-) Transcript_22696:28-966(-)